MKYLLRIICLSLYATLVFSAINCVSYYKLRILKWWTDDTKHCQMRSTDSIPFTSFDFFFFLQVIELSI